MRPVSTDPKTDFGLKRIFGAEQARMAGLIPAEWDAYDRAYETVKLQVKAWWNANTLEIEQLVDLSARATPSATAAWVAQLANRMAQTASCVTQSANFVAQRRRKSTVPQGRSGVR